MKTIVYGGHLSKFGLAFIKAVLREQKFEVNTVFIASADRWIKFVRKLKRVDQLPNESRFKKTYQKQTAELEVWLSTNYSQLSLMTIDSANEDASIGHAATSDIILTAAFPEIFSNAVLRAPRLGVINFHPSYLPRCRGAHPIYWTIASREAFGGVTSHLMTRKIDAGPIIARVKIPFDAEQITYTKLYRRAIEALPKVICLTGEKIDHDRISSFLQEESEATFFRENQREDQYVQWKTEDESIIEAKVRAGGAFSVSSEGREYLLFPPVHCVVNSDQDALLDEPAGVILERKTQTLRIKGKKSIVELNYRLAGNEKWSYYWNNFWFRLVLSRLPIFAKRELLL